MSSSKAVLGVAVAMLSSPAAAAEDLSALEVVSLPAAEPAQIQNGPPSWMEQQSYMFEEPEEK